MDHDYYGTHELVIRCSIWLPVTSKGAYMVIIYLLVFLCKLCCSVASVLSCLCCSSPLFLNLWFKSAGCSLCTFILLLGWDLCLSLHSSALWYNRIQSLWQELTTNLKKNLDDFKGHVFSSPIQYSLFEYLVAFCCADMLFFFEEYMLDFMHTPVLAIYLCSLELHFPYDCTSKGQNLGVPIWNVTILDQPCMLLLVVTMVIRFNMLLSFLVCNINWLWNSNCSVLAKIQILWINWFLDDGICAGGAMWSLQWLMMVMVPNNNQYWPSSWQLIPSTKIFLRCIM